MDRDGVNWSINPFWNWSNRVYTLFLFQKVLKPAGRPGYNSLPFYLYLSPLWWIHVGDLPLTSEATRGNKLVAQFKALRGKGDYHENSY